jgi:hypothetical protein
MCGQPEQTLFHGARQTQKNARKNPCLISMWSSAEAIFLRLGQGGKMNLLRGGERLTNFKGVGGP